MTHSGKARVTLPSATEVLIVREFDASRQLVYRATTTPELVRRWWAGERGTVTYAEIDLRVGGTWRYVMTANEGFEVAFHGEYLELVPDERIVSTEVFEGMPDAAAVTVVTFEGTGSRTTMRVLVRHASADARDLHVNSGMEGGMQEAYDRLEDVAGTLAPVADRRGG